jgi:hypothetical protein
MARRNRCCGYCYQKGHNKRTCPDLKAAIDRRRDDNPSDYMVTRYDEKKVAKVRRCRWCSETGHNARTCPQKATYLARCVQENAKYRAKVLEYCNEIGLGIGAVVCADIENYKNPENRYQSTKESRLFLITDINLNNIVFPILSGVSDQTIGYREFRKEKILSRNRLNIFQSFIVGTPFKENYYYENEVLRTKVFGMIQHSVVNSSNSNCTFKVEVPATKTWQENIDSKTLKTWLNGENGLESLIKLDD